MNSQIRNFIDILQDNSIIFKTYKEEWIDSDDPRFEDGKWEFNEDLLISEDVFFDDELLEFLEFELHDYKSVPRSLLLNNFSQPSQLEEYLEIEYEIFRKTITEHFNGIKESELREIIREIKYARNYLKYMQSANRGNIGGTLNGLIATKTDFCVEAIGYINMAIVGLPTETSPILEYYFSIKQEFIKHRHNILYDMHKNLEAKEYVDCTPDAFKNVFTLKEPKPIQWFKSHRHLTYMIKVLTGWFLEDKNKPSNYYIADRYFQIYKDGKLFQPKKLRHDDDPNLEDKAFLDKVIENAINSYK